MNFRETLRRLTGIIALAFVLAMTTGCNKMLANFSLNQANKRVAESEANKAEQFTKADLDATKAAIAETNKMIGDQDFKNARLKAKEAATQAKALLLQTKTLRADFLKNEANKWLGIAKTNNAELEDAIRYQETIKLNADGEQAHLKKKWDKAIENFDRTVNNVQVILQNLKRQSEQGLNDVKKMKEELIAVEAPEHFPEGITEVDDFIQRIETYITEKYEYRTAISTAEVAVQNALKAKTKSKEVKSGKLISKIETALSRATSLGAQIYAIDNFNAVSRDYEEALAQHYKANYDTILTTGPALLQRSEDLIVETQRESARARVNAVDKAITELTAGKAKQYLPGRVEEMEDVLVRAKALFDQAKYPETEEEAKKGLEKEKKLVDDFDALAIKHISEADSALKVTEGIFGRMEEIFSRPSPIELTGDEKVFQDRKVAMREELRGRLANAKNDLAVTSQNRTNKEFAIAIETSERLVKEGGDIVNGTYRVVSFDAIQELTNLLTVYEREGAREYATAEINEAQDLLMATREAHNRGDYRQALDRGAATHAQLEATAQSLERFAVQKKGEAEKMLGEAKKQRADEFQEGKVAQVGSMIREASDLLNGQNLKKAIVTNQDAINLAESAKVESAKLWAEEEMRRTDLLLARAEQAGAAGYAPAQLGEAKDLRANAQSLYTSADYPQAQITGAQAAEAAERTLFAPVIKAEDEIASAKRFNGWRHEWQRLSEAMVNASYAREFMEQGKYQQALQHATMSSQVASAVVVDAKRAEFYDRLNSLNGKVETAMTKGAGFYQVKDLSKVVGELNAVAKEFQPGGYEEAAEKIEQLEAQLGGLVEMTPNVLADLVKQMNDSLAKLEERGAKINTPDLVAEATRKIKYAQLDFKSEQYRQSFQNAKDALSILQEIDLKLQERDYDLKLSEHFTQLSVILHDFSAVLNAGSPVILQMIKGTNGRPQALSIANASDPTQFRQKVVDLTAQVKLLEPPATRRGIQEASLKMLDQVREGATGFEKMLILDQYNYDDARKIIEKSFMQVRSARSRQQEIQRSLANPQTQSEQRGVKRAVELGKR